MLSCAIGVSGLSAHRMTPKIASNSKLHEEKTRMKLEKKNTGAETMASFHKQSAHSQQYKIHQ